MATKQSDKIVKVERPWWVANPANAEITPEMIEAGVEAYRLCDREFETYEKIVTDVFEAMSRVKRNDD